MKKIIFLVATICTFSAFSQTMSSNPPVDEMHLGTVTGIMSVGEKEYIFVSDNETGCSHKSDVHPKGYFTANESVYLDFSSDKQMIPIVKENLRDRVYANRNCARNAAEVNPYEWVGVQHNELLDLVAQKLDVNNMKFEEYYKLIAERQRMEMSVEQAQKIFAEVQAVKVDGVADLYYDRGLISKDVRNNINTIMSIIKSSASYETVNNNLKKFESTIIKSSSISESDKLLILGSAATARHSSEYWNRALTNESNEWYKLVQDNSIGGGGSSGGPAERKINWGAVGCDLGGFLIGTLVGGPATGVGLAGVLSVAAAS